MPPRRSQREYVRSILVTHLVSYNSATRQTKSTAIDQVLVDKRAQRHLDELEKSNYTELDDEQTAAEGGVRRGHRGTARHTLISDQRAGYKKKKSTMNVRSALMYKKNLATLIEESVSIYPLSRLSSYFY